MATAFLWLRDVRTIPDTPRRLHYGYQFCHLIGEIPETFNSSCDVRPCAMRFKGVRWDLIGLHIVGVNMISSYDIFSGRTYGHLKLYDLL